MSIDLRERKKLKKRTISLMDDWVFKAVIGDPEDEVCLSSFFHAIDPDFRKVRLLPGEKKAGHPDDKAIRYLFIAAAFRAENKGKGLSGTAAGARDHDHEFPLF